MNKLYLIKYRDDINFNHSHNITKSIYVNFNLYKLYKLKLKLWKRFKKYNKKLNQKYIRNYILYKTSICKQWENEIYIPYIIYNNLSLLLYL